MDVAQSQVQAYLTDMMHVTILATKTAHATAAPVVAKAPPSEQKKAKVQLEKQAPTKPKEESQPKKQKEKQTPKKKAPVEVETRTLEKHDLDSSVSLSSQQEEEKEIVKTPDASSKKRSSVASVSSLESEISKEKPKAAETNKRQKKSSDETGAENCKASKTPTKVDLSKVVTPAKKASADDTGVVHEDSAKGESKN